MPPRSDTRIDWTGHKTENNFFAKRLANAYMDNTWQSDMSFVLELDNVTIPAHRLIVGAASPVLERCVYGTGSIVNTESCVINIPDCSRIEFEVFLRYIYTGIVEDLNIKSAATLLSLAHYFDLHELEIECSKCIDRELAHENVCETFDLIHTMENEMVDKCLSWIKLSTNVVLNNGTLMRMQDQGLKKILENDVMHIPNEELVFEKMLTWTSDECFAQHLPLDSVNKRKIMDQRLFLIRFGIMSSEEFTRCLAKVGKGFFSENDISEIMIRIAMGKVKDTPQHLLYNSRPKIVRFLNCEPEYTIDKCEIVLHTNKMNSEISILGFISFNNVVIDESKCNVKYTKIGNQVIFDSPLHFEIDKTCKFHVLVLKTIFKVYGFKSRSMEKHPNISLQGDQLVPICGLIVTK